MPNFIALSFPGREINEHNTDMGVREALGA